VSASEIFQLLVNIAYAAIGLAFIIGCIRWRMLSASQRLLLLLVLITGMVEGAADLFWRQSSNNLALFHGFTIVEFVLLGMIYRAQLNGLIPQRWISSTIIGFSGFAILNSLVWQPLTTFNTNAISISSFLLIGFALAYFYKLLRDMEYAKLERNPWFWFNIGVLLYYSSSFLLFTFNNRVIVLEPEAASVLYAVHAFFHILQYVFYSLTLWIRPQP